MFTLIHGLGALSASTGLTVEDNDGPPVAVTVDGLVVHGGTASSAASPSTSECTDTNDGAATAGAGAELGGDTGAPRSAPLPLRRGLRILSMDGGGVRGGVCVAVAAWAVLALWLRSFVGVPPSQIHELFDLITGCSTGGYLAIMTGIKHFNPDECIKRCVPGHCSCLCLAGVSVCSSRLVFFGSVDVSASYDHIREVFGGQSAVFSELKRCVTR